MVSEFNRCDYLCWVYRSKVMYDHSFRIVCDYLLPDLQHLLVYHTLAHGLVGDEVAPVTRGMSPSILNNKQVLSSSKIVFNYFVLAIVKVSNSFWQMQILFKIHVYKHSDLGIILNWKLLTSVILYCNLQWNSCLGNVRFRNAEYIT